MGDAIIIRTGVARVRGKALVIPCQVDTVDNDHVIFTTGGQRHSLSLEMIWLIRQDGRVTWAHWHDSGSKPAKR